MTTQPSAISQSPGPSAPPAAAARAQVPFGVNEMRLTARQWLVTLGIVAAVVLAAPRAWPKVERFDTAPDYRIPYALSKDYWLYQCRLEQVTDPVQVVVLGDSVVWGEYVLSAGTLSHFLGEETHAPGRFVNGGVNGLFPLAFEGLVDHYAGALRGRKVIVHFNFLWLTSPKADLHTQKEETFNHARLVPQFSPRIPCYKADASERLSAAIEHRVAFSAWVGHLQNTYFAQRSIPLWTLQDDGADPPGYPNGWKNPLSAITLTVPGEAGADPLRGPGTARHRPWTEGGAGPTRFDWVDLDHSLQWHAFQRAVQVLRARGDNVLVLVGPFNEPMIAEDQWPAYRALRDGAAAWLAQQGIAHVVPEALPSELYADASHPLTAGYALLAQRLCGDAAFAAWVKR